MPRRGGWRRTVRKGHYCCRDENWRQADAGYPSHQPEVRQRLSGMVAVVAVRSSQPKVGEGRHEQCNHPPCASTVLTLKGDHLLPDKHPTASAPWRRRPGTGTQHQRLNADEHRDKEYLKANDGRHQSDACQRTMLVTYHVKVNEQHHGAGRETEDHDDLNQPREEKDRSWARGTEGQEHHEEAEWCDRGHNTHGPLSHAQGGRNHHGSDKAHCWQGQRHADSQERAAHQCGAMTASLSCVRQSLVKSLGAQSLATDFGSPSFVRLRPRPLPSHPGW